MTQPQLRAAYENLMKAKADLLALLKAAGPHPVEDHELKALDGSTVRLSDLFGDHDDLLVVHNMGRRCNYCTLWADGFRGYRDHLERRCAFVLCSDDEPAVAAAFSAKRGWNFRTVSGAGSDFAAAMGYRDDKGRPHPGVSAFHREPGGAIVRTAHAPFGPGDDFCPVWPLFDLLKDGKADFDPR